MSVVEAADDRCRLLAVGAFDMSNRALLVGAIQQASAAGFDLIEIDLREVRFIDAGVVRVLLESHEELSGQNRTLRIVGATGLPAMVLDLTRARHALCGPSDAVSAAPTSRTHRRPRW